MLWSGLSELQAQTGTHIQNDTLDVPRLAHPLAIEYHTLTTSQTTEWSWKLQQVAHSLNSVLGHFPSLHRLVDRDDQLAFYLFGAATHEQVDSTESQLALVT